MNLYLDIETVPTQLEWLIDQIKDTISPPGNIKKQESKDKWMQDNAFDAALEKVHKTGFNGTVGEILQIGYAFDDEPVNVLRRELTQPEDVLMQEFANVLAEKVGLRGNLKWIGHNITGFDLRFIWQRMKINKVKCCVNVPFDAKPWESEKVFDTYTQWAGFKSEGYNDLDTLCRVFGIPLPKGEMDGSKVYAAAIAGEYDKIALYCADDVERTRQLYQCMQG